MPYPVRYSNRAYNEYEDILEYVSEHFGAAKAYDVDQYFEKTLALISENPQLFPASEIKKGVRRCVISAQTTLYYRFLGEYVEIITFRGSRMNPKSIGL